MKKITILLWLIVSLALPVSAVEIEAPKVPESGEMLMPRSTSSLSEGLTELIQNAVQHILPDLRQGIYGMLRLIGIVLLFSILRITGKGLQGPLAMSGTFAISAALFADTHSMISMAEETIMQLSDYGKLLFPVMTTAMAAQGGVTSSAALYTGTTVLDTIIGELIKGILLPLIFLFLAASVGNSATGEDILKKIRDMIKGFISWCLKTLLTVFTTYMGITGVVSGTTDAAALKATRVTISSVVPVVGGVLSDASEAVLVSMGLMKNAAGIYGILAVLALFLGPFFRIGCQYLLLKVTAALCSIFGDSNITGLMESFSAAMGLLLAMTGAMCLLVLISTICFLKGVA